MQMTGSNCAWWLQVSFNLPELPCRPKGTSPPAGFCIHRVSPRKVLSAATFTLGEEDRRPWIIRMQQCLDTSVNLIHKPLMSIFP